jgi:glycosyltransferase involved in cell wall biosynthesis
MRPGRGPSRYPGPPPSLTVAFSTRGVRALGLDAAAWPAAEGLDYLVLAQEADADPRVEAHLEALARRPDVTVRRLASTGLSRSRNAALDAARGEILLVADDDVTHPPGAFDAIRGFFAANPGVDLCAGQSLDAGGRPRKPGPSRPRRLTLLNCARISSHELAFRLAPVRAKGLRFDEGFGAGAGTESFLGEEFVFVADCLKAGLEGRAVPFAVSRHPATSSGFVWQGAAAARAPAAVLARVFGRAAPLARAGFAFKHRRRFGRGDLWRFLRG